ncbi:carbon storage regulator CsrA [Mobiluncus curtisii]|uniref:carbon storage regulator CsrA n=1 Tax=Mobiluncus curtisii TaxID=2051 RepID=UPI0001E0E93E|nr:carbon storage regulator CsrA [Mobiluncus curtisii]EFL93955.1 carbon storage regulator [Mobiluncus curtisii subsp. curtisii ATCC 35241]QQT12619.1 carbon storage regulator CsrA [Mobiluncus curtisii]STY77831.1 Carbon storage regulator [Mobiluncus curtisii subsp. curtisii]
MLVLSRRVGEKIVIGDGIVVTVVEVHRDSVRLGVDAPRSVPVNRAELVQAVSEENQAAMSGTEAAAALQSLQSIKPKSGQPLDLRRLMRSSAALTGAASASSQVSTVTSARVTPASVASQQKSPAAKPIPKPHPPVTK